jgi:ferritin-like metal-binding protein YciE
MSIYNLNELFTSDIQYLYNAEKQISKNLPKIAQFASSDHVQKIIEKHINENKQHIQRLQEVCDTLGIKPENKQSHGVEGLIKEAEEIFNKQNIMDPYVMDAALIATTQRIQHYEIAAYGTLRTYANLLGYKEASECFQRSLEEEKETDAKLTEVAVNNINLQAKSSQTI